MTHTRLKTAGMTIAAAILTAALAHGSIRINGNQLMSFGADFDSPSLAKARTATAGDAPRLIVSFGQGVMGRGTLPGFTARSSGDATAGTGKAVKIGIGLSYDIMNVALNGYSGCRVVMTGDVNLSGALTAADIIYLVTYVFKGGVPPEPCRAAGDVNCNGSVTSADIIYMVGFVFKGGTPPCDVCTMIPGAWTCP